MTISDSEPVRQDPPAPVQETHGQARHAASGRTNTVTAAMVMAACGIVYGDIGTSPLYALKVAIGAATGDHPADSGAVLGVVSLILWSLLIVITIKYVVFVMSADNHGEGGIMSLLSLLNPEGRGPKGRGGGRRRFFLIAAALFGSALLCGDGSITPAVSVLSAVEGVDLVAPVMKPYVVPITLVILLGLFAVQRGGTDRIGKVFGPVMILWFVTIGAIGLVQIVHHPAILAAVLPSYGIVLVLRDPLTGFAVLGSVFLAVTGGEALYADMGHVGRANIRVAWAGLVWPALMLNYLGQGGLILGDPKAVENPFYLAGPPVLLVPMVVLATLATIIASQAVISGVFSLSRQAILLGFCPRVDIRQTAHDQYGQIYVPAINWMLMVVTLALVLAFRSSDALASAYGIAVSGTMLITAWLLFHVMIERWHWPRAVAVSVSLVFIGIDGIFFASNLTKLADGGWVPLAGGLLVYGLMMLWNRGTRMVRARVGAMAVPHDVFFQSLDSRDIRRVPGTGVFMTRTREGIPGMLAHYVATTHSLQERVFIVTVEITEQPEVRGRERIARIEPIGPGVARVVVRYGFMQVIDVPAAMLNLAKRLRHEPEGQPKIEKAIYFLGGESLTLSDASPWWHRAYAFLVRLSARPGDFLRLPRDRLLEIGIRIEL